MQADPNSDRQAVRPAAGENAALDRDGSFDAGRCLLEHREHLVGAGFNLATAGRRDRRAKQAPNVSEESLVSVAKVPHESCRVFDVTEQEGHETCRQRAHLAGACLDLAVHPLVFDRELHGCGHRPLQLRILEHGGLVNQRGHRPAKTVEQRGRTTVGVAGKGHCLPAAVQVGPDRLGPVQDRERRVTEHGPQPLFQLLGRADRAQLDDGLAGGRLPALRAQLAGHETDGHDAVLLGRFEQPGSRPISRRFVLETRLVEARERVANVGFVIDRQPPAARRIDIGEGAVR